MGFAALSKTSQHAEEKARAKAKREEKTKILAKKAEEAAAATAAETAKALKEATNDVIEVVLTHYDEKKQRHWATSVKEATKEWAAKLKADDDAMHAKDKARVKAKKEETAKPSAEEAAADKAVADKAIAKMFAKQKALAEVEQEAVENSAVEQFAAWSNRRMPRRDAADEAAAE